MKEHVWDNLYLGSGVEACNNCKLQRRRADASGTAGGGWQHRIPPFLSGWLNGPGPACIGTDVNDAGDVQSGTRARTSDQDRATESLETELKELSDRISSDPLRFQQVREELKRRRETRDEQPAPETDEQRLKRESKAQRDLDRNLVLKITAMESEQAKLVVEAEIFRSQRDEAAARLALLARTSTLIPKSKLDELTAILDEDATQFVVGGAVPDWTLRLHRVACEIAGVHVSARGTHRRRSRPEARGRPGHPLPSDSTITTTPHLEDMRRMLDGHLRAEPVKREPMTREAARRLVACHAGRLFLPDNALDGLTESMIDAVVEASK